MGRRASIEHVGSDYYGPTCGTREILYFLIILQIYTTVSKFIKNKHLPSWATAAARPTIVAHDGKVTADGRVQGVSPAVGCAASMAMAIGSFRRGGGATTPTAPTPAPTPTSLLPPLSGKFSSFFNYFN
jgi:hypothetical protein